MRFPPNIHKKIIIYNEKSLTEDDFLVISPILVYKRNLIMIVNVTDAVIMILEYVIVVVIKTLER